MPLSRTTLLSFLLDTSSYLKHSILFPSDASEQINSDSDQNKTDPPKKNPILKRKANFKPIVEKLHIKRRRMHSKRKKMRFTDGEYFRLYEKYRSDPEMFYEYTKITVDTFDYILQCLGEDLETRVINTSEKLFLTLRHLAQGTPRSELAKSYCLGRSTVAKCIHNTLTGLWNSLSPLHMPKPTRDLFRRTSEEFYSEFGFPNAIGSIGEMNFLLISNKMLSDKSVKSKKSNLVMYAIVDAKYRFLSIEVSPKQKNKDSFHLTKLNKLLETDKFNVPPYAKLPNSNLKLPFVLIGDLLFPLKSYLMRPYVGGLDVEKEIFNEKIDDVRVTTKGAFNVLLHKWTHLLRPLNVHPKHVDLILKVTCLLHNIVRDKDGDADEDFKKFVNNYDQPRKKKRGSRRYNSSSRKALATRDLFKSYFVSNTP